MKKEKRGRKPLPDTVKKSPVTIFVKNKHYARATKEVAAISRKYNTKKDD